MTTKSAHVWAEEVPHVSGGVCLGITVVQNENGRCTGENRRLLMPMPTFKEDAVRAIVFFVETLTWAGVNVYVDLDDVAEYYGDSDWKENKAFSL